MSAPTTGQPAITQEQLDRFADQAVDRVTGIAALRSAQHYLNDAARRETGAGRWVLHFLARQVRQAARRREDRLRDEFFPQAGELGVEMPAQVQVLAPPYGHAWVSSPVVDADVDAMVSPVYEARPADHLRDTLYEAVQRHGAEVDPVPDLLAARAIAVHAPTEVRHVVRWLANVEAACRAEAKEEAVRAQEHREYVASMTCAECGERGRPAQFRDSPSDTPVNDGGEWLETNDGLTICDACGHKWWVH